MKPARALALSLVAVCLACDAAPTSPLDIIATDYVQLALALDRHEPGYVESYYGPESWTKAARERFPTTASIGFEATQSVKRLEALDLIQAQDQERRAYLRRQLSSLNQLVEIIRGAQMSFDEETEALYGGRAPTLSEAMLQSRLSKLDGLLTGDGDLLARYQRHQRRYIVPRDRLEAVFDAAIDECRKRTFDHIKLPRDETLRLSLVQGKPWAAYSWYRGNLASLVELNTSLAPTIDRMVELACHEAYPGHHTMQLLTESRLVRGRGWKEYTVTTLKSPQAAMAEGLAELGTELAFSQDERRRFERDILFPLAGIDVTDFERYDAVRRESSKLRAAHVEVARRYLNRELGRPMALEWLRRYAMVAEPESALRYVMVSRSQIASYAIGEAAAREALEGVSIPSERWSLFERLLTAW